MSLMDILKSYADRINDRQWRHTPVRSEQMQHQLDAPPFVGSLAKARSVAATHELPQTLIRYSLPLPRVPLYPDPIGSPTLEAS